MPRVSAEHMAARRQQILHAAEHCFSKTGFQRTTMPEIIAESGLSTGAVYNYFKSKDEIIAAIADDRHVREQAQIAEVVAGQTIAGAIRSLVSVFSSELATIEGRQQRRIGVFTWAEALLNKDIARPIREGVSGPRDAIAALVEVSNAQTKRQPPLDPDATARTFLALFHGFVLQSLWDPDTPTDAMADVVNQIVELLWPDQP